MENRVNISRPDAGLVDRLSRELKCHPITAAVLVNRNITTAQDASDFLAPALSRVRSPFALKDIEKAALRTASAIETGEKILVFGDYDVDGVTSTVILVEFLQGIGADVRYHIPHRVDEGYGLQEAHVKEIALPMGISLIITADCGSAGHDAAKTARKLGVDVIITDHHRIDPPFPEALAVINPKRPDCSSGLSHLAGVGVVFYLIIALRSVLRDRGFWKSRPEPVLRDLCDMVALGTIADMVPLINENRILTWTGLQLMNTTPRPGVSALCKLAGISPGWIDNENVSFSLAPRINAPGRIGHAKVCVELFLSRDTRAAMEICRKLEAANTTRKDMEKEILEGTLAWLESQPDRLRDPALVLWNDSWHEGLLGILSAKLAERFLRPVVLIAERDDFAKGSARSVSGVDIFKALQACGSVLESFGGHSMAAGLRVKSEKLPLFRDLLQKAIVDLQADADPGPSIEVDGFIRLDQITPGLIDELERLGPFGLENPEPLFMSREVSLKSVRIVGESHRSMRLAQAEGPAFNAIQFNAGHPPRPDTLLEWIIYRVRWNRWNGKQAPQLVVAYCSV